MDAEKRASQAVSLKERFLNRRKLLSNKTEAAQIAHDLRALIASGRTNDLRGFVEQLHPADLALAMSVLYPSEKETVFRLLNPDEAAEVLDEADAQTEEHLIETTEPERLADILEELPADEGADIVGEMEKEKAEQVLSLMEPDESREIRQLLQYPKDSAGGIMTMDFVAVPETATREQALQTIQDKADAESIFYVYVVDEHGVMKGVLDLRKLLTAPPGTVIRDITTHGVVFVFPEFDQEQVADIFARYDLLAMPVLDHNYKLLGVITADDIIDVIHEEHTEDHLRMAGTDVAELEATSPIESARIRLPWLIPCLFSSLISATIISLFKPLLKIGEHHWLLTLAPFIPFIAAMGGNAGTQTEAIVIRKLALGRVRARDFGKVLGEELLIGLYMGAACGAIAGIIATVWTWHWVVGACVGLGMLAGIIAGKAMGTFVPMTLERLGRDPALGAGPFVTTMNDAVGIFIYLGLATLLLHWLAPR